jgi:hypothetical protein
MARIQSGTYEAVRGTQAKQSALREVERALSDLAVCLELLGQVAGGESERVMKDARRAMERVEEWLVQRRASMAYRALDEARLAS